MAPVSLHDPSFRFCWPCLLLCVCTSVDVHMAVLFSMCYPCLVIGTFGAFSWYISVCLLHASFRVCWLSIFICKHPVDGYEMFVSATAVRLVCPFRCQLSTAPSFRIQTNFQWRRATLIVCCRRIVAMDACLATWQRISCCLTCRPLTRMTLRQMFVLILGRRYGKPRRGPPLLLVQWYSVSLWTKQLCKGLLVNSLDTNFSDCYREITQLED